MLQLVVSYFQFSWKRISFQSWPTSQVQENSTAVQRISKTFHKTSEIIDKTSNERENDFERGYFCTFSRRESCCNSEI